MRLSTLDEITVLAERLVSETAGMPKAKKKKKVSDEVLELLVLAYIFGTDRVLKDIRRYEEENNIPEDLRETYRRQIEQAIQQTSGEYPQETVEDTPEMPLSPQEMYETIYKPVAGETFEERIGRRVDEETLDTETLKRIIETDYHRCEETAAYNTAQRYADASGTTAYKVWQTMQDLRVRETHWYIQGDAVPMEARFYTFDGDSARFPGDFGLAENNVNCRCWLTYTFR